MFITIDKNISNINNDKEKNKLKDITNINKNRSNKINHKEKDRIINKIRNNIIELCNIHLPIKLNKL